MSMPGLEDCLAAQARAPTGGVPGKVFELQRFLGGQRNGRFSRTVIRFTGATLALSSIGLLGFGDGVTVLAVSVRPFKLTSTTETRNTCTYCSVRCGILIYGLGDRAMNARSSLIHIESDPDHPANRGTLCPKGSALLDLVHAPTRLSCPMHREAGTSAFKRVSWDRRNRLASCRPARRDSLPA
ncbi:MAG: formate dehydrogenase major subunit [Acetobacteraceae bacterium]|jgi:formate dehydrogenase major subunit|nr:formate dehydrogenase major subunit [Acetobacteraceae bacterium]MEA2874453.1 formate dehydrogenase major subunit [Hyphomicrobiales bacterium]